MRLGWRVSRVVDMRVWERPFRQLGHAMIVRTHQGKIDQDRWDVSWSVPKKHFCCSFVDIGCQKFDCQLQLQTWRSSWPLEKTLGLFPGPNYQQNLHDCFPQSRLSRHDFVQATVLFFSHATTGIIRFQTEVARILSTRGGQLQATRDSQTGNGSQKCCVNKHVILRLRRATAQPVRQLYRNAVAASRAGAVVPECCLSKRMMHAAPECCLNTQAREVHAGKCIVLMP